MSDPTDTPQEIRVLTAKEVSVPVFPPREGAVGGGQMSAELLKIRADFLSGKEISREDMGELLRQTAETSGGGNGNCNIC